MEKQGKSELKEKEETSKNPIKSCFSMVTKWYKIPLVSNAIIISGLFALILHILYSIPAPFEFLVHKWEAGDILTYVSTIALSLLAVWQNQKFKEENDKAQDRLERINIEANEMNVISRIVDFETQYLMRLEEACLGVLSTSQTYRLLDIVVEKKAKKDKRVKEAFEEYSQSYIRLISMYESCLPVEDVDIVLLKDAFKELNTLTCKVFSEYHENNFKKLDTKFVDSHMEVYHKALKEMNEFLSKRRGLVHRILINNIPAKEVKMIYSGEKH